MIINLKNIELIKKKQFLNINNFYFNSHFQNLNLKHVIKIVLVLYLITLFE